MIRTVVNPNRTRYTFFIDPDQLATLRQIKQDVGVPESEQIRRAINQWLEAKGVNVKVKTAKPTRGKRAGKA